MLLLHYYIHFCNQSKSESSWIQAAWYVSVHNTLLEHWLDKMMMYVLYCVWVEKRNNYKNITGRKEGNIIKTFYLLLSSLPCTIYNQLSRLLVHLRPLKIYKKRNFIDKPHYGIIGAEDESTTFEKENTGTWYKNNSCFSCYSILLCMFELIQLHALSQKER